VSEFAFTIGRIESVWHDPISNPSCQFRITYDPLLILWLHQYPPLV